MTPAPDLDFSALTRTPSKTAAPKPRGRAIMPHLIEPETMPLAPAGERGVTVPFVGDGPVVDLAAYHRAGIPGAPETSTARPEIVDLVFTASRRLPPGFGLAIFDAWRPLAVQQTLYEIAYANPDLPPGFVTPPSLDPQTPPPHLTGGTVDVTLTWKGQPLALGTDFDDFTPRAHARSLEATLDESRNLRRLLFWTMRSVGFIVIDCEWWHFEHGTRRWAALTGAEPLYGPAEPA